MDKHTYWADYGCAPNGARMEKCPEYDRRAARNKRGMRRAARWRSLFLPWQYAAVGLFIVLGAAAWWWLRPRVICRGQPARVVLAVACVGSKGPIAGALDRFKADMGRYPTSAEGLQVLVATSHEEARFHGPYFAQEALRDPWGNPFGYRCPGSFNPSAYDLWSYGPNERDDGGRDQGDDISN